jgi:hypothetical protein
MVSELKPVAQELIAEKAEKTIDGNGMGNDFVGAVEWDIIHLLMEAENADLVAPSFFASQGFWYVHGRFPCGNDGDFPAGRPVIY